MGRTVLSPQRRQEIKKANIGRVIIFCEGKTEKYYFEYFGNIMEKNKYTDVQVVLEQASGNAQTVLNYAENFLAQDENIQKYAVYGKYLAFDCDDPPEIEKVISAAQTAEYGLLMTNYLFETWLLMHFEDVEEKISKKETYRRLTAYLRGTYKKGQKGVLREILQNGSVEKAIENARRLEARYIGEGKTPEKDIKEMNPFTSVHPLIEQFMLEISETEAVSQ